MTLKTPECIAHWVDIKEEDNSHYPGSTELLSISSPFGEVMGLEVMGIHHETLPPGRRTSWPHAERDEEEFVYVIEGHPDVWIDGHLVRLDPGNGVGFPKGTGIAHTFINNTDTDVRLLVVGEKSKPDGKVHYPLHPDRNAQIGERHWNEGRPERSLGAHDGLPERAR